MRNYVFGGLRASLVENMLDMSNISHQNEKKNQTSNIKQA